MSKLYYKNLYRGELTDKQAQRITEAMALKPRPVQITVNGELLKLSQIEILKEEENTPTAQSSREFEEKMKRTEREIDAMRKWSVEKKIMFNITRNFSVRYLLRVGYTNYLGKGWEKEGDFGQKLLDRYKRENEESYFSLCEILREFFEKNTERYWCSSEVYKQFLPSGSGHIESTGERQFASISETMMQSNIFRQ